MMQSIAHLYAGTADMQALWLQVDQVLCANPDSGMILLYFIWSGGQRLREIQRYTSIARKREHMTKTNVIG